MNLILHLNFHWLEQWEWEWLNILSKFRRRWLIMLLIPSSNILVSRTNLFPSVSQDLKANIILDEERSTIFSNSSNTGKLLCYLNKWKKFRRDSYHGFLKLCVNTWNNSHLEYKQCKPKQCKTSRTKLEKTFKDLLAEIISYSHS